MYCKNCGAPIDSGTIVCGSCGAIPEFGKRYCPYCGSAHYDPDAILCLVCGCFML